MALKVVLDVDAGRLVGRLRLPGVHSKSELEAGGSRSTMVYLFLLMKFGFSSSGWWTRHIYFISRIPGPP